MENRVKNQEEVINSILESLDELKLPALSRLNDLIKEKFGLKEIAFGSSAKEEEKQEEEKKTSVSVILTKVGDQRIPVFNVIKEATGKSILEVKKLTDVLPFAVLSNLDQQKAEELKEQLEAKGAEVEIK